MGGSDDKAQRAAENREKEREARISANVGEVNRVYDDPRRMGYIEEATNAVREMYRDELDRVQSENNRQVTFAMARSGQAGGSLERDTRRQAGESYQRANLDAERGALGFAADARAQDEQSRQQLISMAMSGGDIGNAGERAAASLQNSLQAGRSAINVRDIGQAFDTLGDTYERSRQQAERRRGFKEGIGTLYGEPGFGFGGNG